MPTSLSWSFDTVMDLGMPPALLYSLAFAASFRMGAAITVIGQPRMPINDNYPVGSKIQELSSVRLRLLYPCIPTNTTAPYCTDSRATADSMAGLVGFRQLGLSFLLAHLADADSGCFADAKILPETFPLLIYSHGYGGNMDMATYFLRNMASQGMVVAALEHADGTASSTLINGTRLDFNPSLYSLRDGLALRAKEMVQALEYLSTALENVGPVFMGGHSYGAPTAVLASQQAQIEGLILHDPALTMGANMLDLPPKVPTVSYTSDEYSAAGVQCGMTYHVQGAFHGNFVDAPLWAPLWVMRTLSLVIPACGPADPLQVHCELAQSAKVFVQDPRANTSVSQTLFENAV